VDLFGQNLFAHLEDFSQSTTAIFILDKSDIPKEETDLTYEGIETLAIWARTLALSIWKKPT